MLAMAKLLPLHVTAEKQIVCTCMLRKLNSLTASAVVHDRWWTYELDFVDSIAAWHSYKYALLASLHAIWTDWLKQQRVMICIVKKGLVSKLHSNCWSVPVGGVDDVSHFTQHLIEEPDAMFSSDNRQGMVGLVSFLEQIKFEIHQFIDHGMWIEARLRMSTARLNETMRVFGLVKCWA